MRRLNSTNGLTFDHTVSYLIENVLWWAPHPLPLSPWKNIIYVFHPQLWQLLFITLILYGTLWILIEHSTHQIKDKVKLAFGIIAIFLQNGYPSFSKHIRAIVILWILFGIIMNASFNAKFYSALTTPFYQAKLQTIEEAASMPNLKFGVVNVYVDAIGTYPTELAQRLLRNPVDCGFGLKCVDMTVKTRDLILTKTETSTRYFIPKHYLDAEGIPMIYSLERSLYKFHINFIMIKGFPLLEKFNELLMLMLANGMISKWIQDFKLGQFKTNVVIEQQQISMNHIWVSFLVLFSGIGCGLLVFLIEIAHEHFGKKNKNK